MWHAAGGPGVVDREPLALGRPVVCQGREALRAQPGGQLPKEVAGAAEAGRIGLAILLQAQKNGGGWQQLGRSSVVEQPEAN